MKMKILIIFNIIILIKFATSNLNVNKEGNNFYKNYINL